jgi:ubiquinone/menaquinone biosynthesis C-methylase UbiE
VAAGFGTSALFLARSVGCRVEGPDLSHPNLARAARSAKEAGLDATVRFLAGDADALPYRDGVFDAVLSECAFCTFPDKGKAAREIFRVLAPGGRLGLADVTLRPESLPDDLRGVLLQAACLSDARTAEGYRGLLAEAGFRRFSLEEHPEAVSALLGQIRARLLLARLASLSGQWRFDGIDLEAVEAFVARAEELVRDGVIGYVLLVGERSDAI